MGVQTEVERQVREAILSIITESPPGRQAVAPPSESLDEQYKADIESERRELEQFLYHRLCGNAHDQELKATYLDVVNGAMESQFQRARMAAGGMGTFDGNASRAAYDRIKEIKRLLEVVHQELVHARLLSVAPSGGTDLD